MYIKAAKTHSKAGKPAYSFRLVKSTRVGGKVRQIALPDLGTGFSVLRESWRELCHLVEMKMVDQESLLDIDPALDGAARAIARKLRARSLEKPKEPPRTAEVDLDSLEHEDPLTVGGERICLKTLEDLRFAEILREVGFSDRDARIACAVVVARMLHPASERETGRWLRETSAAAELLGLEGDGRALARRTLYRVGDRLQAALFGRERELLDIPETIVFYDLSNVHFHGGGSGEQKPTVVMDAGIASEANLEWLSGEGCGWITIGRGKKPKPPKGEPDIRLETTAGDEVKTWRLEAGDKEKKLYVVSEGRKKTEVPFWRRSGSASRRGWRSCTKGWGVKGRMKRRDKVLESVGRLKEKYSRVARQYSIDVDGDEKGANAVAVRFRRNRLHAEADEVSGSYLLRAAQGNWDDEAVPRSYWRLSEVEATFRPLKSEFGLRPVFHQLDKRIRSHLLIAALAYHPAHLIRTRLKSQAST